MATEENDDMPDLDARDFLCVGHSAHSYEAGRTRRLCADAKVRQMSKET